MVNECKAIPENFFLKIDKQYYAYYTNITCTNREFVWMRKTVNNEAKPMLMVP